MRVIYVRKNLVYDPTSGGKYSYYEGYCRVTEGTEDPGILPLQELISLDNARRVFCSPAKRARESVGGKYEVMGDLGEVKFMLSKLVSKMEYNLSGSVVVRQKFLEMFIRDTLGEQRTEIKRRVCSLMSRLGKLPRGRYLLISHSFLMKILEAYIFHKDLFENPGKLSGYLNPKIRTYNFGEGFEFEI
jgi:hypothetical protein